MCCVCVCVLDYDVGVDLVPFVDLRHEAAAAGCHWLWDVDLGFYPYYLLRIVYHLVGYVYIVYMAFTRDVCEYEREDLRLCDAVVTAEGVELGCKEAIFVDDLVIEVNRYEFVGTDVVSNLVALGKGCDYAGHGTYVLDTGDCADLDDP